MHTAKAAVYVAAKQPFEIREYPLTAPPPGMAKLRLIASGVCGTDIHIHRGKIALEPPKIIGHEFVGRVEEIGEEDSRHYGIRTGDAVIVDIASPCGKCLLCRQNDDANCLHMQVTNGNNPEQAPHFWGGYGEYNYSPVQNLIKIIGSSQYSLQDVRQYLHFMATHPRLHPTISSLITAYPLDEINQAFADAKAGKNIKTLLV